MTPTLTDGQWVLALRGTKKVTSGDIVLFTRPGNGQLTVKRCILNGTENPYVTHGWLDTQWGKWFLDERAWNRFRSPYKQYVGTYFMVGDNQFHSLDSRQYGYIGREHMIGRVIIWRKHD